MGSFFRGLILLLVFVSPIPLAFFGMQPLSQNTDLGLAGAFGTIILSTGFVIVLLLDNIKVHEKKELVSCPACNEDVSPDAEDCPNCGDPLGKTLG